MNKYKILNKNRGFSLVEAILAIAIFSILATGVFYVATNSYTNFYGAGDKQAMAEFAQEGVEAVKSIRDNSWQDIEDAVGSNHGVSQDSNGYWQFSGESDTRDVFTRVITIENAERDISGNLVESGIAEDPNVKLVTVTISADGVADYVLTTYLSNWSYKSWQQTDWTGIGDREFWAEATMASSSHSGITTSSPGQISNNNFRNGYGYRVDITIPASSVSGTGNLANYPVLISETQNYLKTTSAGGNVYNANGYDIVFSTDSRGSGSNLDHEIEKYDGATGELVAWVEMPLLYGDANNTIYMFYSSSTIATTQENVSGTWVDTYEAVWHLAEDPSINSDGDCGGGFVYICDSTSNNNDAYSGGGMTSGNLISGKTGYAIDMDGKDDYLVILDSSSLDSATGSGQARTSSLWLYISNAVDNRIITEKSSFEGKHFWLQTSGTSGDIIGGVSALGSYLSSSSPLSPGTWKYIVVTYSGSQGYLYIDGVLNDGPVSMSAPIDDNSAFTIGGGYSNTSLDASFDEVRISRVERSADWIKTEYDNMNSPSTFYSLSSPVTDSTTGYLYSSIYDLGNQSQEIRSISVEQAVPDGCTLEITLETSNDPSFSSPSSHVFSDSSANYYTSSTPAILNNKRYLRYKAYLEICGTYSAPQLFDLKINYR